jgi:hypothetical protein
MFTVFFFGTLMFTTIYLAYIVIRYEEALALEALKEAMEEGK